MILFKTARCFMLGYGFSARDLTFLLRRSVTSRFLFFEDARQRRLNVSANPPLAIIAFLLLTVPVTLSVLDAVSLDPVSETFPVKKKRKESLVASTGSMTRRLVSFTDNRSSGKY